MNTEAVIAIFVAGGISFGWGWYRGGKGSRRMLVKTAKDTLEILAIMSVIAEDEPDWTRTINGSYRARMGVGRVRDAHKGRPGLVVTVMPSQDSLGDEIVIDMFPAGVPR